MSTNLEHTVFAIINQAGEYLFVGQTKNVHVYLRSAITSSKNKHQNRYHTRLGEYLRENHSALQPVPFKVLATGLCKEAALDMVRELVSERNPILNTRKPK